MKVVVAMDKYKGSLSALEAGAAVKRGLLTVLGDLDPEIILTGIADGGEGTALALVDSCAGTWVECRVHDAQGRARMAQYGWLPGNVAVMEMSAASGLAIVADLPLNPDSASTFGTGEMMLHVIQRGAQRIIIGIGGSATNDGGMGMAQALGFVFLDEADTEITQLPVEWERVRRIVPTTLALPGFHLMAPKESILSAGTRMVLLLAKKR
jgi:glycerate kinase